MLRASWTSTKVAPHSQVYDAGELPALLAERDGSVAQAGPRSEILSLLVSTPEITVATPAHRTRIVGSLVAAFTDDPVLRYLFPDRSTYPRYAASFFGHLFDKRVHRGSILTIEGGASVAIWEPPPVAEPPAPGPVTGADPPAPSRTGLFPAAELARVHAYDEALHAALPAAPYWYLGVLGTHPDYSGRRWGHAVMEAGLRRAAADRLPAVLETSNPGNVEVYRRAGWEVVGTVTDPLPIWVMRSSPERYAVPAATTT